MYEDYGRYFLLFLNLEQVIFATAYHEDPFLFFQWVSLMVLGTLFVGTSIRIAGIIFLLEKFQ